MNGTLVGSQAKTGAIATSTNPLQIGGDSLYGAVLQRPDRRGARLQHRAERGGDPDRHEHADRRRRRTRTPPSAPGTLTASAVSAGEIDLSWGAATDNVGVTGYQIERCSGTGCSNFAQIATPPPGPPSTTPPSPRRPATPTASGPPTRPATSAPTPTPPAATTPAVGQPAAVAAGNAVGERGRRRRDRPRLGRRDRQRRCHRLPDRALQGAGCTNFAQIATATGTTYKDTGVAASTSYSYRVRAVDAAGNLGPLFEHRHGLDTRRTVGPGRGVRVRRGLGDDGRRRLGQRQQRHDRERHLGDDRQVRQGAPVQRHERARHHPRRGVAAPHRRG